MIKRLILALLLLGCARSAVAQQLATWHDRDVIAATLLTPADGRPVRIGQYRGKVVVIDFWGAWCTACIAEMASLKQLQANLADSGNRVVFLFVSVYSRRFADDAAWLRKSGVAGANYRWDKRTGAQYHAFFKTSNSRWWVPDALILDADGNIAKWIMGGTDWTQQTDLLRKLIPARASGG